MRTSGTSEYVPIKETPWELMQENKLLAVAAGVALRQRMERIEGVEGRTFHGWAGPTLVTRLTEPHQWQFIIPELGGIRWVDSEDYFGPLLWCSAEGLNPAAFR